MSKKLENALLIIWVVSLTATLGSLYFSEIRGYEPCTLCWYQRILMYPIVLISTIAYIQKNAKIALTTAVFSTIGAATSLYHYSLQKLVFMQDAAPACGRVACTGQYINWLGSLRSHFWRLLPLLLLRQLVFIC